MHMCRPSLSTFKFPAWFAAGADAAVSRRFCRSVVMKGFMKLPWCRRVLVRCACECVCLCKFFFVWVSFFVFMRNFVRRQRIIFDCFLLVVEVCSYYAPSHFIRSYKRQRTHVLHDLMLPVLIARKNFNGTKELKLYLTIQVPTYIIHKEKEVKFFGMFLSEILRRKAVLLLMLHADTVMSST